MKKNQSAVEWLFQQLTETWYDKSQGKEILEQAKQMEKEQIMVTWYDCKLSIIDKKPMDAEEYFNETYGN